jgi:hypothetical protein
MASCGAEQIRSWCVDFTALTLIVKKIDQAWNWAKMVLVCRISCKAHSRRSRLSLEFSKLGLGVLNQLQHIQVNQDWAWISAKLVLVSWISCSTFKSIKIGLGVKQTWPWCAAAHSNRSRLCLECSKLSLGILNQLQIVQVDQDWAWSAANLVLACWIKCSTFNSIKIELGAQQTWSWCAESAAAHSRRSRLGLELSKLGLGVLNQLQHILGNQDWAWSSANLVLVSWISCSTFKSIKTGLGAQQTWSWCAESAAAHRSWSRLGLEFSKLGLGMLG